MLAAVKEILTREVHVKEFLEMEIELEQLKKLLATEIKLKEFLVQEIDLTSLLPKQAAEEDERDVEAMLEETAVQESYTPAKKLLPPYDFYLVESLHDDHKEILFIYNQMMKYAREKDFQKVAKQLEIFSTQIRAHYHKADVELYTYLKTYIQQKYPKREKPFSELSLEMKNISIEIFYTISQSPNVPLNDFNYEGFMEEFKQVGIQMNNRINREESVLFNMYRETNEATDIS